MSHVTPTTDSPPQNATHRKAHHAMQQVASFEQLLSDQLLVSGGDNLRSDFAAATALPLASPVAHARTNNLAQSETTHQLNETDAPLDAASSMMQTMLAMLQTTPAPLSPSLPQAIVATATATTIAAEHSPSQPAANTAEHSTTQAVTPQNACDIPLALEQSSLTSSASPRTAARSNRAQQQLSAASANFTLATITAATVLASEPAQTVELKPDAASVAMATATVSNSPAHTTSPTQPVALPSQPVALPSQPVALPSQPVALPSQPVDNPSGMPSALATHPDQALLPTPITVSTEGGSSTVALPPDTPQPQSIAATVGSRAWPEEFVQRVQGLSHNLGSQEVELQLNPPELGPLSVHIKISDQQASATFSSPHSVVRDAIETSLPKLREGLANNGITLGNASVNRQAVTGGYDAAAPLPDTTTTRRVVPNRTVNLSEPAITLADSATTRTTTTTQGIAPNAPLRSVMPPLKTLSEDYSVTRLDTPKPSSTRSATVSAVTADGIVTAKPEVGTAKVVSASVQAVVVSQPVNELRSVNMPSTLPAAVLANAPDVALSEPSVALFGASAPAVALPTATPQVAAISAAFGSRAWSEEFVQRVQGLSHNLGNQEIALPLNPPELGSLSVHIKISDQQASATFSSPHSAVREAIETSLPKLREGLANNGITLGNTSVNRQAVTGGSDSAAPLPDTTNTRRVVPDRTVNLSEPAITLADGTTTRTTTTTQGIAPNAPLRSVMPPLKTLSEDYSVTRLDTPKPSSTRSATVSAVTAGGIVTAKPEVGTTKVVSASVQAAVVSPPGNELRSVNMPRTLPAAVLANAPDVALSEPSVALFGASVPAVALPTATPQVAAISAAFGSRAWPEEFVQRVQGLSHNLGSQEVELQLNPPELGPLSVHIKISDQQASATFSSPHSAVREAIETSLPKLREGLANNGITLGNTSVNRQAVTGGSDSAVPLPDTTTTRRVVPNRTVNLSEPAITLADSATTRTTTTTQGIAPNAPLRSVMPTLKTLSEDYSVTRLDTPKPSSTRSATVSAVTAGGIVTAKPEVGTTKVVSASVQAAVVSPPGNELRSVNMPRTIPAAVLANAPDVALSEPSVALFGASVPAVALLTATPQVAAISAAFGSRAWPEEFVQRVQGLSHNLGSQEVELQLNPPELGPLSVHIKISDQQASATFSSPHSAVREAIETSLPKLREGLANNGITLGNASVNDQTPRDNGGAFFNQHHDSRAHSQLNERQDGLRNPPNKVSEPLRTSRHDGTVDTFA